MSFIAKELYIFQQGVRHAQGHVKVKQTKKKVGEGQGISYKVSENLSIDIFKSYSERKSKTSNVVFVVASHYQMPSSYIFALGRMSFSDLPLL